MGFLKKKDTKPAEPVIKYSEIEQGKKPEPPVAPGVASIAAAVDQVIKNQQSIVENQQMILNEVLANRKAMLELSGIPEPEPELTEEEVAEALEAAKRAKKR